MPMGFLSGTFSTNIRSVVYFSSEVEKNGTSTKKDIGYIDVIQSMEIQFELKCTRCRLGFDVYL